MTAGQQRALRELERLRAVSAGCFDFHLVEDEKSQRLIAHITIRLGPMETRPGGLDLHERENFLLCVPPGFPFDRPWVNVTHERFREFPHVVWGRTLCL